MSDTPLTDIRAKIVVALGALNDPLSYQNPSQVILARLYECLEIIDNELGAEHG